MKICQPHWDRLRKAIADRGMEHLGAKSGEQAIAAIVTELEGREAENEFDPLMACHNMICSEGLKRCGLRLMAVEVDDAGQEQHLCPICESMKEYETWWIEGPADEMLKEAKDKGLL